MFPLISPPGGIECNSGHLLGLVYPQVVKLKQYLTVHEQLCGLVKLSMHTFLPFGWSRQKFLVLAR